LKTYINTEYTLFDCLKISLSLYTLN